jgi:hypothetical protein
MQGERSAMPADDGSGLHDLDGSAPACPHSGEQYPQEPVGATEAGPFRSGLLEQGELVAQGKNLGFKFGPSSDAGSNGSEHSNQGGVHSIGVGRYQADAVNLKRNSAYRILVRDNQEQAEHVA